MTTAVDLRWLQPLRDLFLCVLMCTPPSVGTAWTEHGMAVRRREAETLAALLRGHVALSQYDLKDAAAALVRARTAIAAWQAELQVRPLAMPAPMHRILMVVCMYACVCRYICAWAVCGVRAWGGLVWVACVGGLNALQAAPGPSDGAAAILTLPWLRDWHTSLVAKCTLYFYRTLDGVDAGGRGPGADARLPKSVPNHAAALRAVQTTTGAMQVSLLYHVQPAAAAAFDPSGYALPGRPQPPLTGIYSFQTIFGHPLVRGPPLAGCTRVPNTDAHTHETHTHTRVLRRHCRWIIWSMSSRC